MFDLCVLLCGLNGIVFVIRWKDLRFLLALNFLSILWIGDYGF